MVLTRSEIMVLSETGNGKHFETVGGISQLWEFAVYSTVLARVPSNGCDYFFFFLTRPPPLGDRGPTWAGGVS